MPAVPTIQADAFYHLLRETAMRLDALMKQPLSLPTVPKIAARLISTFDQDEVDLQEIARCISTDPVLTAKLLKVCNSAAYSGGARSAALLREFGSPTAAVRAAIGIAGLLFAADIACFFVSIARCGGALATLLSNCAPLAVLALAPWLLKQAVPRAAWAGAGLAVLGVLCWCRVTAQRVSFPFGQRASTLEPAATNCPFFTTISASIGSHTSMREPKRIMPMRSPVPTVAPGCFQLTTRRAIHPAICLKTSSPRSVSK